MRKNIISLGIFAFVITSIYLPSANGNTNDAHLPVPVDRTSEPFLHALAEGISYIRIRNIEQSLSILHSHLSQKAVVIDLRFVTSNPESIKALGSLLSINSRPLSSTKAILVLCNRETSAPLGELLQNLQNEGSIIAIGSSPHATNFTPKLSVNVLPEEDSKAYQALLEESELDSLINENVIKDRYDEARLIKDFQNNKGLIDSKPLRESKPDSPADEIVIKPAPPPLTDDILQRAYFLIKALEGLGKLSSI